MKPVKLMEREYSTPILGGGVLPVMNAAMGLGFSDFTMILVAIVSCFYAALRVVQKTLELKYGGGARMISVSEGSVLKIEAVPAKPDKPAPSTP